MEKLENNAEVALKIQGIVVKCNRQDLIEHSDYFRAMFEGNFVESASDVICLNDVDLVAMQEILKLLWDKEYPVAEENILSVLEAVCMLQFLEIKEILIQRILEMMNFRNCLRIWFYTESIGVKILYKKAKLLALMEFARIKELDSFLELTLNALITYVGNRNLYCGCEFTIYRSIMKWYEKSTNKNNDNLLKLMHCLDFTTITPSEIEKMLGNSCLQNLTNTLQCILRIKSNLELTTFEPDCIAEAQSLLKSKNRNLLGFPSMLADKLGDDPKETDQFFYDKFKRKRKYNMLENWVDCDLVLIYLDVNKSSIRKLVDLNAQKCSNLDGFKILGYKQFIYLFGGEFLLGKGDWNCKLFRYDTIIEKWKQEDILPYSRRHFESCISGKYLYIVGGTGPFRVIQENLFWYDLEEGTWSIEHKLPCSESRQIKCCSFQNNLFLLNINNKCGYSFNMEEKKWIKITINDDNNLIPPYSQNLNIISVGNSIYIKEKKLYELKLIDEQLVIVKETALPLEGSPFQMESVACNKILYSLNRQLSEDTKPQTIWLESLNPETLEMKYIFNITCDDNLDVDKEIVKFRSSLLIFNVFNPNAIIGDDFINDYFKTR